MALRIGVALITAPSDQRNPLHVSADRSYREACWWLRQLVGEFVEVESGKEVIGTNLSYANLSDADLSLAAFLTQEQLNRA